MLRRAQAGLRDAPLRQRANHAPQFVAQNPSTALHRATSGHRPIHGHGTATAGRSPHARPGLNMQPRIGLNYRPQGANAHTTREVRYSAQENPRSTTSRSASHLRNSYAPRNPEQRAQALLARARELVGVGNIDRRLGQDHRAYQQYSQARVLFQQARNIGTRHHLSGETMMDLGGTGRIINQAEQNLLRSGYTPIF